MRRGTCASPSWSRGRGRSAGRWTTSCSSATSTTPSPAGTAHGSSEWSASWASSPSSPWAGSSSACGAGRGRVRHAGSPPLPPASLHHRRRGGCALLLPDRGGRLLLPAHRGHHHLLRDPIPPPLERGAAPRARGLPGPGAGLDHRPPDPGHGDVRVGGAGLLPHEPAARRRHARVGGGQALDVEAAAPHGPARDQRAARPRGAAGEADHHLRGHHPQLLHPRLPDEEGRGARALQHRLVPGHEDRHLPPLLRGILRHRARDHDRPGGGDGARRVPDLARGGAGPRVADQGGGEAVRGAELRHLPPDRLPGPGADRARHLRQAGEAAERGDGDRRRRLPPGVDLEPGRQGGGGLPARHAHLPGPGERGVAPEPDRLHPVPAGARGWSMIMSTKAAVPPKVHYLNADYGWKSWLFTTDHKRIALLYLVSVTLMFFLGGAYAVLIRLNLIEPTGSLVTAETYNKLFTAHGVIMVFFFLIPSIPATLGNFLIPLMIGAKDLAFPRINLLSWYLYILGALFTLHALINGGLDTGWTFYTPYSTAFANTRVITAGVGIFVTGFSSILTGLNFIVTIHKMRAPGLTWFRLPLFVWAHYATSVIQILGTPVIAVTVLLVAVERAFHFGFFDPARGGDPILFQHLFWFYSHPAVYIMVLPAMGVISELVACFSRKKIFGYSFIAMSSLAIAGLSFLVWAHHMFVTGLSVYAAMVFSALSFTVGIPSAIKVFNWTATLYRGSVSWQTPMLYAIGFIGLFTMGGLTGLFLATLGIDVHVTDTYFIVAHFHYIMVGGTIMAYLGGLHFWWPKISGRLYPEWWARVSAVIVFIGFNLTFFPQFIVGYLGMPRRYHVYPAEFQVLNVMSSPGASILGVGYLIPMVYLAWSMRYGKIAPANRWPTTSPTSSSRRSRPPSGCGFSWSPRSCSSGGSSPPTRSTGTSTTTRSPRAATTCPGRSAAPTPWCSSAAASPWPWPCTRRRWGRRGRSSSSCS